MAEFFFWACVVIIFYVYVGYHAMLKLVSALFTERKERPSAEASENPRSVSTIVTCYNEEKAIQQRIENLLDLDYPAENHETIIVSDGSTDRTVEIAREYEKRGVKVIALERVGRAPAHNRAVAEAHGEILLFTDADTLFERNFLRQVLRYFDSDERTGCVVGNLVWEKRAAGPSKFREMSWRIETDLKDLESRLGILASGCGPAMALRKSLWSPMTDSIDDIDSVTPLDVVLKGYRVVFANDAVAYDVPYASAKSDFQSKIRGVSKSIIMIPRRWSLRDWVSHPLIAWRTLSHHILRWIAPFCMLGIVIATALLWRKNFFYRTALFVELGLGFLVLVGYAAEVTRKRIPVASLLFSFAAINAGFALGVLKGLAGAARGPYETE